MPGPEPLLGPEPLRRPQPLLGPEPLLGPQPLLDGQPARGPQPALDGQQPGDPQSLPDPEPMLQGATAWQLLESVPDGLVAVDAEGRIGYVNRQLEELTGYHRSELIGCPVEILVPETARDAHRMLRTEFGEHPRVRLMGNGTYLQLRRKDGSMLAVEIGLAPVRAAGTDLTAASIRDVTVQRAGDHARRQLLELLDLVPDAVAVVNTATLRIEYVNQGAVDLLGYSREQLVGMPAEQVNPEVAEQQRRAEQAELIGGLEAGSGGRRIIGIVVRDRAGTEIPCVVHIQVTPGADGVPRAINVLRDDRGRREQEERLRASEESFRAAFEQAPTGMAVVRVDGRGRRTILRANQALAGLLRLPVEQLAGRDFADFSTAEDEPDTRTAAQLAGELPALTVRKRCRRADGTTVWVDLQAARIELPDPVGTVTLAHLSDVDQLHQDESRRGQEAALTKRLAEISTALLGGATPDRIYAALASAAAEVTGSENGSVALPYRDREPVRRVAVFGPAATELHGKGVPFNWRLAEAVAASGSAVVFDVPPPDSDPETRRLLGPMISAPVVLDGGRRGLLSAARGRGAEPFRDTDLELLTRLATQVGLAITLAMARADQERLALLEDRQRVARDLHDTVIQDLIAIGMQLNARLGRDPDHAWSQQDLELIDQVEETLRGLRGAVFALREQPPGRTVTSYTRALANETARVLGHRPMVTVQGPVDDLPAAIADQLVLVLREALSNVARHAGATRTSVIVQARPDRVRLVVDDDGRGLPDQIVPGHGIANMQHRAAALGGTAKVSRRRAGGTRVEWVCPLPNHDLQQRFADPLDPAPN